jgi:hypothetical protein
MSKTIKIKNKANFIKNFLSPISKIGDASVLELKNDKLTCLTCTSDNSIIYYVECDVYGEFDNNEVLNCPDIKKLIKAIDTIQSDSEISFEIEENNLSYKSNNLRFKYHLQEDGIIKKPKLNLQKLNDTEFNSSFTLKKDLIKELIKGSVFSSDSNKIYFFGDKEGVYAELTDKTRNNIDTITLKVCDVLNGDNVDSLPLNFEIFRIIDVSSVDEIKVQINNKLGLVLFELQNNYNKMTYIMSSLTK